MRRTRPPMVLASLAAVAASAVVLVSVSTAAPLVAQACSLRGSWVANTAETNRDPRAINPTSTSIRLTSGALSATFDRRTVSFGSLGLRLVARKGATTLKQEIDIQTVSPYRVSGARLVLGRGTYKLHYVSVVVTTSSGVSAPVDLPDQGVRTPGTTVPYTCTPSTLHWRVPVGTSGVMLTFRRDRG